ncbi:ATP-binding cassette domain-containing protein [Candidatus Saccharibacteria bacterium]|nr:ATP-binding cassette domain-containing protein [Candidatus Saccharibacteria bacterium]
MQPLIRITEIFPNYDFLVEKGEFIAIFGDNDLEMNLFLHFLGFLEGDLHDFYLNGQSLETMSESELSSLRQSEVGFYFSDFDLLPAYNIIENVALPLRFSGMKKIESLHKASAILESFGLRNREYFFPHQLSEIQKQRVCLARAVANDPSILLVENPTKNLGLKSKTILLDDLKRISMSGTTIILSTNDNSISSHASRIIRIEESKVILDTPTNERKDMPTFTTAAPKVVNKKPLGAEQ